MLMGQEAFAEKVNAAILLGWEPQCCMAVRCEYFFQALGNHSKGITFKGHLPNRPDAVHC